MVTTMEIHKKTSSWSHGGGHPFSNLFFRVRGFTSDTQQFEGTRSIASPSNKNSWHGLAKLNTMTLVFFTFIISPHSAQHCWSAFNCCWSPTFDSDVKARFFTKNNSHMCTCVKVGASHFLLSKCPSRNPNIAQIVRGWSGNLASHLTGTRSWRWHPCLGGWCVWYPWHTSPASIVRSILPPQG